MTGQSARLDVVVTGPRDVPGAAEGGADRLLLADHPEQQGLSPEPALVSAVCREASLPVRVVLRLTESHTTTGGEVARLVGLAGDYLAAGAEGLVLGFLDRDLEIDRDVCGHLAAQLPGVPWAFHPLFDRALETRRAWRDVRDLPGLDGVLSAGSPRGLEIGSEDLIARATADPVVAELLVAGGGLRAEDVPWLVRAGVRHFYVGRSARPGASWGRSSVDAGHVRAWRLLVDDETGHARARPPGTAG